jgi:hypothetical protein
MSRKDKKMKNNAMININLSKEYKEILRKEKLITPIVCQLAKDFKVTLSGLENRVKSWHSAFDKATVRTNLNSFMKMNDMVRYTFVIDAANFGETVNQILSAMDVYGIRVQKVVNYWTDNNVGYNGVNVQTWVKNMKVEIQFHTPDSLRVKTEKNHPVYEKMRAECDPVKKEQYRRELMYIGDHQARPSGVEDICLNLTERMVM